MKKLNWKVIEQVNDISRTPTRWSALYDEKYNKYCFISLMLSDNTYAVAIQNDRYDIIELKRFKTVGGAKRWAEKECQKW